MRIEKFIPYFFSTQKAQKGTKKYLIFVFGVMLFGIVFNVSHAITWPNDPKAGQVLGFDDKNSLKYEQEEQNNSRKSLVLKYQVDGTSQTWDLTPYTDESRPTSDWKPIGLMAVYGIHYADPHHVWMITHLSKRFGGAVLLNLKAQKLEKGFAFGFPYSISPDGSRLAYAFPLGHNDQDLGLMIDSVLVYPEVKLIGDPAGRPEHWMDITDAQMKLQTEKRRFVSEIHDFFEWINEDTFSFIAEERPETQHPDLTTTGIFYEYTVTGLKKGLATPPDGLKEIKTTRKELTPAEAYDKIKKSHDAHYGTGSFAKDVMALNKRLETAAKETPVANSGSYSGNIINPEPGVPIRFDAKNSVLYDKLTHSDASLRLRYQIDGTSETWAIAGIIPHERPWIEGVTYPDPHHLWVFTDLFKIAGAHLLDLDNRKILKSLVYYGEKSVSPDGLRLACTYPVRSLPAANECVLVDGLAIYPIVMQMGDFQHDPHQVALDSIRKFYDERKLYSRIYAIQWLQDDTLWFIGEEFPKAPAPKYSLPGKFLEYTVTGLKNATAKPADLATIKVTRKELTPAETVQKLKAPYDAAHGVGKFEECLKKAIEANSVQP